MVICRRTAFGLQLRRRPVIFSSRATLQLYLLFIERCQSFFVASQNPHSISTLPTCPKGRTMSCDKPNVIVLCLAGTTVSTKKVALALRDAALGARKRTLPILSAPSRRGGLIVRQRRPGNSALRSECSRGETGAVCTSERVLLLEGG